MFIYLFNQLEIQFTYSSSHGGGAEGIHSIYKISYLYRMDYICKNKNLKTTGGNAGGWPLNMVEGY
jgi:hypothetical protein